MGKGDRGHKETKKAKKSAKTIAPLSIMAPPPEVAVIKKGKQREGRRMEEAEE
jgi:hypothetical protein